MTDGPRHATIVAYYGATQPAPLTALVETVQGVLGGVASFRPRPVADVHATLVGLENTGRLDLPGLSSYLGNLLTRFPLRLQFGGFADGDLRFTSRGLPLFERALTVSGTKVVLVGWPVDADGAPTEQLDGLRRSLGEFGAHHSYFDTPGARDPDAYLVIGELGDPSADALAACLLDCRRFLAATPCRVPLSAAYVRLATYADTRLPAASTRLRPLDAVLTSDRGTPPPPR